MKDRQRFDELFRVVNPEISDLTFSNLLMWRRMINFRVSWTGGFCCLVALPYKYPPYAYAPIGDMSDQAGFAAAVQKLRDYFALKGWGMRYRCVPADIAPTLVGLLGGEGAVKCEEDRDFFDYVYLASDLINLGGKKYDGKRNHLRRFLRSYDHEYQKLGPEHLEDCFRIMYDHCVAKDCDCLRGKFYSCDRKPSMELLSHIDRLPSVRGGVVVVDGRAEAFTVGEALNRDTAVVYIEKANARIEGLYTFINQQFCEQEWSSMQYINREEDEGVEGLRKAKLSYHPFKLVEKYTITIK